jgi:hypothetical protein
MLVFTRDNAPVSLKVVECVKSIDVSAVLSCHDVDPLAFATFEKMLKVRAPMGRPGPPAADMAQDAVKRGFAAAVSATLLSPTQYPVPVKPVPAECVVDLIMAAREHQFLATIADSVLSLAIDDQSCGEVMLVFVERMLSASQVALSKTQSALKKKQVVISGLSEADEKALEVALAVISASMPEPAPIAEPVLEAYPGDASITIEPASAAAEPVDEAVFGSPVAESASAAEEPSTN